MNVTFEGRGLVVPAEVSVAASAIAAQQRYQV